MGVGPRRGIRLLQHWGVEAQNQMPLRQSGTACYPSVGCRLAGQLLLPRLGGDSERP